MVAIHPDIQEVLISEELIQSRVRELGRQISTEYEGKSLLLVGILKGAVVFLADLARAIDVPTDFDFVSISSYCGTESSGEVRITNGLSANVKGKYVVIVEDIVDTGRTLRMSCLIEDVLERGAADVKVCALLDKPSRRRVDVPIDYRGFTIGDCFVVGYGLDYCGRYRNLPYVGVLKPEICEGHR